MKIEIDFEKENVFYLKHIKWILDKTIEIRSGEDPDTSIELIQPLQIFRELQMKIGRVIPLENYVKEMTKRGFKRK